jgi:hypothetical protein
MHDPRRVGDVYVLDRKGEEVLAEIMSRGVEFISGDVYTEHLLEELRQELKRSRVKSAAVAEVHALGRTPIAYEETDSWQSGKLQNGDSCK